MWNFLINCCERIFIGYMVVVGCLVVISDYKIIVFGLGDFILRIWSIDLGECLYKLEGYYDFIKCLGIIDDNCFVIVGLYEGKDQLLLWDFENGNCVCKFIGYIYVVMNLKIFLSDGFERELSNDYILMISFCDGIIKVWNIVNGKLINLFDF